MTTPSIQRICTVHLFEKPAAQTGRLLLTAASIETSRMSPSESLLPEDILLASCLALRQMSNLGRVKGQRLADLLCDLPDKLDRIAGTTDINPLVMSYPRAAEALIRQTGPKLANHTSQAAKRFISTLTIEESGRFNYFMKHKGFGFFTGPMEDAVICSVMAVVLETVNRRGSVVIAPLTAALQHCAITFSNGLVSLTNQRQVAGEALAKSGTFN